MGLNKQDQDILEEIVKLDGSCFEAKRCSVCPFRSMCLPEFVGPNLPASQSQRREMAFKVLTHNALTEEGISREDIKENYTWPTSER